MLSAMITYKDSGVDVEAGDAASAAAYRRAAETFASRAGMIGMPVLEEGGYAGMLDMGEYYLVQTDDGTGTKMDIGLKAKRYGGLGSDLLAMVADDAVCTGAEVISVSNTLDVPKVDVAVIDSLLRSLAEACTAQKIVIPAGEIAEVPGSVTGAVWSATAVGILEKDKVLQPKTISPGDAVISLREYGARSNGFTLIRTILERQQGQRWYDQSWDGHTSWAEAVLTPSVVYHDAVLSATGRYRQSRRITVKGIAHITGGGIPSKLRRILRWSGCGAELHDLWEPPAFLRDIARMGNVTSEEAYRTWNMGNGMLLVVSQDHVAECVEIIGNAGIDARLAGTITKDPDIVVRAYDGTVLRFAPKA